MLTTLQAANTAHNFRLPFRASNSIYHNMALCCFFPGGHYMAQWILNHPEVAQGKDVIDIGSGSGVVALAAATVGARHVEAWDQDPRALPIIAENAVLNNLSDTITPVHQALRTADQLLGFDGLICAADIFYTEDDPHEAILLEAAQAPISMLLASFDSELAGFRHIAHNFSAAASSSQPEVYVRMFYRPKP